MAAAFSCDGASAAVAICATHERTCPGRPCLDGRGGPTGNWRDARDPHAVRPAFVRCACSRRNRSRLDLGTSVRRSGHLGELRLRAGAASRGVDDLCVAFPLLPGPPFRGRWSAAFFSRSRTVTRLSGYRCVSTESGAEGTLVRCRATGGRLIAFYPTRRSRGDSEATFGILEWDKA